MTAPEPGAGVVPEDVDLVTVDAEVELAPASMRARARLLPIAVLAGWELALGLVVATPFHGLVRATFGAHPDGDSVLFLPGGRALVALLPTSGAAVPVATRTTLALVVVSLIALQLPAGALLASFVIGRGPRATSPRQVTLFRHASAAFAPLTAIWVLGAVVQGVLVAAAFSAGAAVTQATEPRFEDLRAFVAGTSTTCALVVLVSMLTPALDLARAAVVRGVVLGAAPRTTASLLVEAARVVYRLPRRRKAIALAEWAARASLGASLVAAGAAVTGALPDHGAAWLGAPWLIHQAVIVARTALRASWLARASRAVAREVAREDGAAEPQRASER